MKERTNLTGNPINAVRALLDSEIPLWFRLTMLTVGCVSWGGLIMVVLGGGAYE